MGAFQAKVTASGKRKQWSIQGMGDRLMWHLGSLVETQKVTLEMKLGMKIEGPECLAEG